MPKRPFLDYIVENVVLFDGAMGTQLYERGIFINRSFDELNLSDPSLVKRIHAEYVEAGADVIETNTFTANSVKLEQHGLSENLAEINYKGAKLAREVAGDRVYVAGAIGPLGIRIEPWGPTSVDEAKAMFAQQAEALLEGGVDLFVLETFSDINEIWQAIRAVREVSSTAPIVAHMTLGDDGDSLYGTAPEVFAQRLEAWGADVIGVNCSVGPAIMLDAIERMARTVNTPLSAAPNAGMPRQVDGRNIYLASPEYMASYVKRFIDAGARVVGGCCGTTPHHIRAIHSALRDARSPRRTSVGASGARVESNAKASTTKQELSPLARRIAAGEFVTGAEVTPARGLDQTLTLAGVEMLRKGRFEFIVVGEPSRGSASVNCQALAQLLEREVGIETVLHQSCRDRKLVDMQSDLLGAYSLGLRNVICETGDAPTLAEGPTRTSSSDVDSIGLTNMVRQLNDGRDIGGGAIGHSTSWHIGVVANPTAVDLEAEVRRFEWKVDAGAQFCVTRPIFEAEQLENFLKRIDHCRIPLLVGLRPLASSKSAEFLSNEVPGIQIPDSVLERMRAASARSEEAGIAEGVAIARELLERVRSQVQGVVVATPFDHFGAASAVMAPRQN